MPAQTTEAQPTEATHELPATMEALTQDRYGEPRDVIALNRIDRPDPGKGEVLIEVHAAGVDRGVWHLVAGLPYMVRLAGYGLRAPKNPVPGLDVAGTVVAIGEGVSEFAIGDEVLGIGRGTYARWAVAPVGKLTNKPAGLSFEQAAAVPVSGLTALQAVRDQVQLERGSHVLVLGASGGVGSWVVQIAKAFGAEVTGVASGAKLDFVRRLGADHVLDYECEEIGAGGRSYDAIIDTGGNRSLGALRRALKDDGRLVIVGGEGGSRFLGGTDRQLRAMLLSPFVSQRLGTFISSENGEDLETLAGMIDRGEIEPAATKTYPLARGAEALEDLVAGRAEGKLVVSVAA